MALYILADVQLNITIAQCYQCSSYSCIFLSIVYPTNVATEEANMYGSVFGSTFYFKKS